MMRSEEFDRIMKNAMADPDFSPQTANISKNKPKQAYGEGSNYEE